MLLSFSKKIEVNQYTELVPNFLNLLSKYGYSQAQIESTVKVKKDDKVYTYKNISVKEIIDILSTSNFIKGDIFINQENKRIQLQYREYFNDFYFETDSPPSSEFKNDLLELFKALN
jgi:hypothetical protein